MVGPPYGIYDSFTEKGLFWLPAHPQDQISGTLTYGPEDGAALSLLGMLGGIRDGLQRRDRSHENAVIHGLTTKGKPVSLLHAFAATQQLNMPGMAIETWKSNLLIIGWHLVSANDDAIFLKSYFRFEAIESWLEHNPFTIGFNPESKAFKITAKKLPDVAFASHAEFDVSSVGSLYTHSGVTQSGIDARTQMAITPHEPKSLNWHLMRARRLQELASLCAGQFLPLTSFELRGPDVEHGEPARPAEVHLYARMIHGERRAETGLTQLSSIVTGPELVRFNPKAVQLWFDQFEDFDPALRLFFTVIGADKMFTNIRLLLAIQAIEVFHRRTSGETVMNEAKFAVFAKAMVERIPHDTEPQMREKLISLYVFANEPSLKQRLRSIVASLSDEFGEVPAGFDSQFLRKLVDTRNYYTHFSENLSSRVLDGNDLHWATRRIVLLLSLLFLRRLGIEAKDIKSLLGRHREFAQLWASPNRPS